MKKNRMMRLASGLLVAVLVTTSMIGGTFAKYTTQVDARDSARVAKFGVVLQADGKLYGKGYKQGEISVSTPTTTSANLTVKSNADNNIVAPGTMNDKGLHFAVNGTPEVSTKITATITAQNIYLSAGTYAVMVEAPTVTETSFAENTYYTEDQEGVYTLAAAYSSNTTYFTKENEVKLDAPYYPVVYMSTDHSNGTTTSDSLNAIAVEYAKKLQSGEVTGALEDGVYTYTVEKQYDPNFNYTSLGVEKENITWSWAFGDADKVGSNAEETDLADTILGDLMAGAKVVKVDTIIKAPTAAEDAALNDYCLNTGFSIDITVTQVD